MPGGHLSHLPCRLLLKRLKASLLAAVALKQLAAGESKAHPAGFWPRAFQQPHGRGRFRAF